MRGQSKGCRGEGGEDCEGRGVRTSLDGWEGRRCGQGVGPRGAQPQSAVSGQRERERQQGQQSYEMLSQ